MNFIKLHKGAIAGSAAGFYISLFFMLISFHTGRNCSLLEFISILAPAGFMLGFALDRLLLWADRNNIPQFSWMCWLTVIPLPLTIFLNEHAGANKMGIYKFAFSSVWIAGIFLYGYFLMKSLFKKFDKFKISLGLTALLLLLNASLSTYAPRESDECDYAAAALSLFQYGSTKTINVIDDNSLKEFYFNDLPPSWYYENYRRHILKEEIKEYSYRMLGYPVILAPFIGVAKLIQNPNARWFISNLPGVIAYFILIYSSVGIVCCRIGNNPEAIISAAILTPFLFFASNLQPEIWMTAFITTALYSSCKVLSNSKESSEFTTGIMIGMPLLFHERMVFISIPFILIMLYYSSQKIKILSGFLLALIPSIISYAIIQEFKLPTHLPHAYGTNQFFTPAKWVAAIFWHLFSIDIGIFTHLPVLWLLFFEINKMRVNKRFELDKFEKLSLLLFLIYFGGIITYPHSLHSIPHLRYLVPALPFLLIFCFNACRPNKVNIKFIYAIIILQLLRNFPFLVVPSLWRWITIY